MTVDTTKPDGQLGLVSDIHSSQLEIPSGLIVARMVVRFIGIFPSNPEIVCPTYKMELPRFTNQAMRVWVGSRVSFIGKAHRLRAPDDHNPLWEVTIVLRAEPDTPPIPLNLRELPACWELGLRKIIEGGDPAWRRRNLLTEQSYRDLPTPAQDL
jgi:hypothetical protein